MPNMTASSILAFAVLAVALGGLWSFKEQRRAGFDAMSALPATGAGVPQLPGMRAQEPPALQPEDSGQPGSTVRGRVAQIYVRVQEGVYLALERAPQHLREAKNLYVEIEYPDALKSGETGVRGYVGEGHENLRVGDIVAVRLAHKHQPKVFPIREITRVTELVAPRDSELARAFERRILARQAAGTAVARESERAAPLREALQGKK